MNTLQESLLHTKKVHCSFYSTFSEDEKPFAEVFRQIDDILSTEKSSILIAIDGPCASGKSTLAELIAARYACNVFHTDDFFLRPEQKTPERLREVGGNIDRERLCKEILMPLRKNTSVLYRAYSCKTQTISDGIEIPFHRLNLIEGSYSLHPELRQFYDLKIVLHISDAQQLQRLQRREDPESFKCFCERWIPFEKEYAAQSNLFQAADLRYYL